MFNLAELWGLRPDGSNPCRHVKHYPERKRDRFLTPDELGRVGQVLAEFEEGDFLDRNYAAAIRLLALTGCRFGEILSLQWKWVNILAGTLDLPDAKAGGRRVPLGAAALELLLSLQTAAAGPWVVAGASADQPMNKPSLEHAWVRIRKSARIEDVRLHDFRHTVGTYSGQAGHNAFVVRDLLGHKTLAMTSRYVGTDIDPLRAAATTWPTALPPPSTVAQSMRRQRR